MHTGSRDGSSRGFTLIELLVVIAIIGVLSGIVMTSLNTARMRARNAERKSDLRQAATALEMYYSSYDKYPCGDADMAGGMTWDTSTSFPFLDGRPGAPGNCVGSPTVGIVADDLIATDWLQDPLNGTSYRYIYEISANRQTYILYARLESDTSATINDGGLCNNAYEFGPGLGTMTPAHVPYLGGLNCN